ncbi:MAG: hypothetical protein J0G33_13800 [Afipia felis]|nr:hypothetical protein [Afipia felis]
MAVVTNSPTAFERNTTVAASILPHVLKTLVDQEQIELTTADEIVGSMTN